MTVNIWLRFEDISFSLAVFICPNAQRLRRALARTEHAVVRRILLALRDASVALFFIPCNSIPLVLLKRSQFFCNHVFLGLQPQFRRAKGFCVALESQGAFLTVRFILGQLSALSDHDGVLSLSFAKTSRLRRHNSEPHGAIAPCGVGMIRCLRVRKTP